jgi:hypothetical protein
MSAIAVTQDQFLSLRLGQQDAALMQQLHEKTGLSKTDIVKQALRQWAASAQASSEVSLYDLGEPLFGQHGDSGRQSSNIKSVVRERLAAKRSVARA